MQSVPAETPISSEQRAALLALCERYVRGRDREAVETSQLAPEVGLIFGCGEKNMSAGAQRATRWMEACWEAMREGEPEPLFPKEFVVVKEVARPTGKGKKAEALAQATNRGGAAGLEVGAKQKESHAREEGAGRPEATYHTSRKPVPGTDHYFGDCPTHALAEEGIWFLGDLDDVEWEELQLRAATNFRFVDKDGCDVSVGHGPTGLDSIYLIAACGSLNPLMEGGQRLAAGWWNSDPDPTRANWKAPAEIIWLKIPVQYIAAESAIKFRGGNSNLITVDGKEGTYVLQCPDPGYVTRWEMCFEHFNAAKKFEGVLPTGPCPNWFEERFWEELKDEYQRWKKAGHAVKPPAPPEINKSERKLLKLECDVAWYLATIRNSLKGIKWCDDQLEILRSEAPNIPAGGLKAKRPPTVHDRNILERTKAVKAQLKGFKEEEADAHMKLKKLQPELERAKAKFGPGLRTQVQPVVIPPSPSVSRPAPPAPPASGDEQTAASPAASFKLSARSGSQPGPYRKPVFARQEANQLDEQDVINPNPGSDMDMSD